MAKIHTRTCKICGKEFKTDNKRLCCSDECSRANGRLNHKMRNEKIKQMYSTNKSRKSISDIAVRAREVGMSYGQYTAMMEMN